MTSMLGARRLKALDDADGLPPDIRECVHEFGMPIVTVCLKHGVRDPRHIRELVREIWEGARHIGQRRPPMGALDWLLIQAGAQISAATLVRMLRDNNYCVTPIDPTREMLNASMREVSGYTERITKEEKHRRRLRAAIQACNAQALIRAVPRETSEPQ
jgi:hypothetical protein